MICISYAILLIQEDLNIFVGKLRSSERYRHNSGSEIITYYISKSWQMLESNPRQPQAFGIGFCCIFLHRGR